MPYTIVVVDAKPIGDEKPTLHRSFTRCKPVHLNPDLKGRRMESVIEELLQSLLKTALNSVNCTQMTVTNLRSNNIQINGAQIFCLLLYGVFKYTDRQNLSTNNACSAV